MVNLIWRGRCSPESGCVGQKKIFGLMRQVHNRMIIEFLDPAMSKRTAGENKRVDLL
jgi:hypothetical protein